MPDKKLTSEQEHQIEQLLLSKRGTTFPITIEQWHKSIVNSDFIDPAPAKTRAYIESFFKRNESKIKRGKTLKGEDGIMWKRGK